MLNFKSWRLLLKNCTHLNFILALFVSRKGGCTFIPNMDYQLIKVNQYENREGQLTENYRRWSNKACDNGQHLQTTEGS